MTEAMEGEWSAMLLFSIALSSIIYTYFVTLRLPKGICRLLSILPVIGTYLFLPLKTSILHLRGMLGFLFTWVSSFKLLMLCYDIGPLASPSVRSSLPHFIAMSAFPIKISSKKPESDRKELSISKLLLEFLILVTIIWSYTFLDLFPTWLKIVLYGAHMYLILDISLVSLAALADCSLGADLEPQFNKPYLARSLEDFWGRRWNLIVTNILRPSVYDPVLYYCQKFDSNSSTKRGHMKPPLWGRGVALVATFLVSGFMHEIILYYLTESEIKGDMMAFFVLHGCCTAAEVWLKRASWSPEMMLPEVVSVGVTLGFILVTSSWLFFPKFVKTGLDVKGIAEYEILARKMTTMFNGLIF